MYSPDIVLHSTPVLCFSFAYYMDGPVPTSGLNVYVASGEAKANTSLTFVNFFLHCTDDSQLLLNIKLNIKAYCGKKFDGEDFKVLQT